MKVLNRDAIKYIAVLAMTCNHIALVFLEPGTALYEALADVGYFTAVTMCYFLVEGYSYTHDRKRYGQRLLVFGIISQIPYLLALPYVQLNMLVTLYICYQILRVMDSKRGAYEKNALVFLLFCATIFSDWALLAPLFTILFADSRGDRKKTRRAFLISAAVFALWNLTKFAAEGPPAEAVLRALCSSIGILAAGAVILGCYNGRRSKRGRGFSKWFFYVFYPAHLLALGVIKVMM